MTPKIKSLIICNKPVSDECTVTTTHTINNVKKIVNTNKK